MKKLGRNELKNLKGGNYEEIIDDGATCCTSVSDCPGKAGYTTNCKSAYQCPTDTSKNKCIYSRVIVE